MERKAKLTQGYAAMIETAGSTRHYPSLAILTQRLAKALGVPVTALLE